MKNTTEPPAFRHIIAVVGLLLLVNVGGLVYSLIVAHAR